jgi:PTH1 family peptidyl-tRNA hydrolase
MKLIVGLGNPGEKYRNNRHNVGYLVVDKLKTGNSKFQFPISNQFKIFKSDRLMNDSGGFVRDLISKYPSILVSDVYVVHDDLDIPLGQYKIQFGIGPKLHKGIESIDEMLGTKKYWRVRIGIDNRLPNNRISGEAYVLQDFTRGEKLILDKVIDRVCKKLVTS